jgi:hypothetical protein
LDPSAAARIVAADPSPGAADDLEVLWLARAVEAATLAVAAMAAPPPTFTAANAAAAAAASADVDGNADGNANTNAVPSSSSSSSATAAAAPTIASAVDAGAAAAPAVDASDPAESSNRRTTSGIRIDVGGTRGRALLIMPATSCTTCTRSFTELDEVL